VNDTERFIHGCGPEPRSYRPDPEVTAVVRELEPGVYLVEGPGPDPLLEGNEDAARREARSDRLWMASFGMEPDGSPVHRHVEG
jgi:hypothetical protein